MTASAPRDLHIQVQQPARSRWRSLLILAAAAYAVAAVWFGIVGPLMDGTGIAVGRLVWWSIFILPFLLTMLRLSVVGQYVRLDADGITYALEGKRERHLAWSDVEAVELDGRPPWTTAVITRRTGGGPITLLHTEARDADSPRVRELLDVAAAHLARHRDPD